MPKRITDSDAPAFGKRLVALLEGAERPRRGAGAYLSRHYRVSTVTANAWLNGEYKPNTTTAKRIANDHGTTFEALYFGDGGKDEIGSTKAYTNTDVLIEDIRLVQTLMAWAVARSIPDAGLRLYDALDDLPEPQRGRPYLQDVLATLDAALPPQARRVPKRQARGPAGRKRP